MGKIKVGVEADPEVNDLQIIKLILQPIVENAVFHGLEPKLGDGKVMATITKVGDRIRIQVEDDGCGIQPDQLEEMKSNYESIAYTVPDSERVPEYMKPTYMVDGTGQDIHLEGDSDGKDGGAGARHPAVHKSKGIGIGNIIQRLKLFYETDYSFSIDSEVDVGTRIVITVPDQIREEILEAEAE